jgi:hypothetical protein
MADAVHLRVRRARAFCCAPTVFGQLQPKGGVVDESRHIGGGGQRGQVSRTREQFEPPVATGGEELPLIGTEMVLGAIDEPHRAGIAAQVGERVPGEDGVDDVGDRGIGDAAAGECGGGLVAQQSGAQESREAGPSSGSRANKPAAKR